ncbi:hypothetical protein [Glaciihabitans sp. dw_435]|uniref:hypothetical protein n=1 Tax=Glaciihabitans sp. dw_435 TaxID=2720081 RepID=UPI001BD313C9|nr:hypothetical protein [Glaciihabitans sp. dw_435]
MARRSRLVLTLTLSVIGLGVVAASVVAVVANQPPLARGENGLVVPRADRGDAADIAALRASVPAMLAVETSMGRTDVALSHESQQAQYDYAVSPEGQRERRKLLATVATPRFVASDSLEWDAGMADNRPGGTFTDWTSNRFEATRWDGVVVDGDTATVVVVGKNWFYDDDRGGWTSTPRSQDVITLVRDPSAEYGWLIDARSSADVDSPA